MEKVTEFLHVHSGFYMAIFISKFFQTAQSTEPKLFVGTAMLNFLISRVFQFLQCTVPVKVLYATFEFII